MEKVFIDTSGWVAIFVENDKNHKRALSIYDQLKRSKASLYTSDYVIDETITTILARGGHRQSLLAGTAILTSSIVKIIYVTRDYFQSTWELYQKYKDKRFSFTDVSCLSIMKNLDIRKAFSFDREFIQAGIEVL